jgi:hypothetical protein
VPVVVEVAVGLGEVAGGRDLGFGVALLAAAGEQLRPAGVSGVRAPFGGRAADEGRLASVPRNFAALYTWWMRNAPNFKRVL